MPALKNKSLPAVILFIIYAATLIFGILLFIAPPPMYPDPSWGFMVMRSMEHGAAFNHIIKPDPADISRDTSYFLSWWSPGQYLVPYFFKKLFSITTGQAIAITVTLCNLTGLTGFYKSSRKAGFNELIASLSLLFVACQVFFITPYTYFNGGEVLVFAFCGWFLYGCLSIQKTGWQLIIFTLMAGLVGFFCKSSMMWVYIAGALFMWLKLSVGKPINQWIRNGVFIAVPFLAAVAIIYFFYLSKGVNPSTETSGLHFTLQAFTFPLASPLLTAFSLDDIVNGFIYHTDAPLLSNTVAFIALILLAILSVVIVLAITKRIRNEQYRLLVFVFYVIAVLFFTGGFLRQADISYEARHFRIVGLVIIPGMLYCIGRLKIGVKAVFGLLILSIGFIAYRQFYYNYKYNRLHAVRGRSGIVQPFIDKPTLDFITAQDARYHNAVFVFLSADLAQEVNYNRVIVLDPIGPDVSINFDDYVQKGRAGPVFMLIPRDYYGPKMNILLKCFPGYKGFHMASITDDYLVLSATQAR